jgi:epoxyqueuosine reductase
VICLAVGCDPPAVEPGDGDGIVARYARGREYHKHLKKRCRSLLRRFEDELAEAGRARIFVDSAPVMERSLAVRAGLGWIGRNGCLIVPGIGSHVLLAEIITDLELAPDSPVQGDCGDCGRCVEACPTGALSGDGLLDARLCLSWQSEQAGPLAPEIRDRLGRRIWGCDTCQEACPHNDHPGPGDPHLAGEAPIARLDLADLLHWDHEAWDRFTRGRGLRSAGLDVLLRNAVIAAGNSGLEALAGPLQSISARRPELESEFAWALARLGQTDGD